MKTLMKRQHIRLLIITLAAVLAFVCAGQEAVAQVPTEINVEIDYMVLRDGDGNAIIDHRPQQDEIDAVVQMFACHGIELFVLIDDEIPFIDVLQRDPEGDHSFFNYNGPNSFGQLRKMYRDLGSCWHYCVFGHRYVDIDFDTSSSSGLGELGGDEFIVTLGGFTNSDSIGTPFDRASTFAHELGHNLELRHAGSMNEGETGPHTPNYPSTMSYFCQLAGVRTAYLERGLAPQDANLLKEIDYSNGRVCTIHESALDELFGVGLKNIDWDCDSVVEGGLVSQDLARDSLGHWCISSGRMGFLHDYNDWAAIRDNTCAKSLEELNNVPEISCVTFEEQRQYLQAHRGTRQPPLAIEPCVQGRMIFAIPSFDGWGSGWCDSPFRGVAQAHDNALPGDILYLKYGDYNEPTGSLLLTNRMLITTTHRAVIRPVGGKAPETQQ